MKSLRSENQSIAGSVCAEGDTACQLHLFLAWVTERHAGDICDTCLCQRRSSRCAELEGAELWLWLLFAPALHVGYTLLMNLFWISTVANEGTLTQRLLHVLERKIGMSIVFKQLKNSLKKHYKAINVFCVMDIQQSNATLKAENDIFLTYLIKGNDHKRL